MRTICGMLATLAALLGPCSFAFARAIDDQPASLPASTIAIAMIPAPAPDVIVPDMTARLAELQQWIHDYSDWEAWSAQWTSRRQPGWLTSSQSRREKPVPPAWLADECRDGIVDDEPLLSGCMLLTQWSEDVQTTEARIARAAAVVQGEQEDKTTFWNHVHLDMLWPATQWRNGVYGVVGTHIATTVAGRLQVFIAPGVMFLNLPTLSGTRAWKLAANYGIGYRLFDFGFGGGRRATMHLNLAKAWLLSDYSDVVTGRSMDFVGLSMTFRKDQ